MTDTAAAADVDAITVEVVRQSLIGVVQEMQNSLFCTGYSTIIRESKDASCAIEPPRQPAAQVAFRYASY